MGCVQQNLGGSKSSINTESRGRRPECVGFSEINKYSIECYKRHFPTHKNWGSATDIVPEELPDFDMLCGGFPCQAFSIAGKRLGFEDTRGTLFFDIARIIKVKRPRIVFLENVKGLLNHDNGRTFTTILATFDELGYNVEWEVLNSKYFGVPQNRERVFIIGHLRGTSSRQIFPLGQDGEQITKTREFQEQIASTLTTAQSKQGRGMSMIQLNKPKHSQQRVYDPEGISPTISAGNRGGGKSPSKIISGTWRTHKDGQGFREMKENVSPAIPARAREDGSGQPVVITHSLYPRSGNPKQGGTGHLSKDDGTAYCVDTGNCQGVEQNQRIRRLTPTECEFLQGFPKNWTKNGIETFNNLETYYKVYGKKTQTNSIKILQTLQQTISEAEGERRRFTEYFTLLQTEILQPRMYETEFQREMARKCFETARQLQSKAIDCCNRMFNMWKERNLRYTPQRQKQIEQLFGKLRSSLQKLPHQTPPKRGWMEQDKSQDEGKKQSREICVITEISDTQRYKTLGNAVTTNVITAIAKSLYKSYNLDITTIGNDTLNGNNSRR